MRSVGLSGVKTHLTERLDGVLVVLGLRVHFKKLIKRVCIIIILIVSSKIKISIFFEILKNKKSAVIEVKLSSFKLSN
jgi:hypothetical protein